MIVILLNLFYVTTNILLWYMTKKQLSVDNINMGTNDIATVFNPQFYVVYL